MQIIIRHRAPFPKPWKWEIPVGKRLVTASHEFYSIRAEARSEGKSALDRIILEFAKKGKSPLK